MTAGGAMMFAIEDGTSLESLVWVPTRVSPVRVNFNPRMTPTEPNGSSSTSSASEAYSRRSLLTFSRWFLVVLTTVLCLVRVPAQYVSKN